MIDGFGRCIDYMRISVTDRCDLRCVYCMPQSGVRPLCRNEILRYEEITRLAEIFARLGIKKIRLTGGEPLVRSGLPLLVEKLKAVNGVETVVMTTNGMLLKEVLPALAAAGLDGANISLDAVEEEVFSRITRGSGVENVLEAVRAAKGHGIGVKLNCVPTEANRDQLEKLADFAAVQKAPLRFIELMPIGEGRGRAGLSEMQVREILGDMRPAPTACGRDKCRYFVRASGGVVGFISAVSHRFCSNCNRIRLTADGFLKTCLQYGDGVALRPLLREKDAVIAAAIEKAVQAKPARHHFGGRDTDGDETRRMWRIGG